MHGATGRKAKCRFGFERIGSDILSIHICSALILAYGSLWEQKIFEEFWVDNDIGEEARSHVSSADIHSLCGYNQ
jgi:hypothetical protein